LVFCLLPSWGTRGGTSRRWGMLARRGEQVDVQLEKEGQDRAWVVDTSGEFELIGDSGRPLPVGMPSRKASRGEKGNLFLEISLKRKNSRGASSLSKRGTPPASKKKEGSFRKLC